MVVLITGASRGIGACCAEIFAKSGYKVAINYNNSEEEAKSLLNKIKSGGGIAEVFHASVCCEQEVNSMIEKVEIKLGSPGILINNAGICCQKLFTEITVEEWDEMFKTNVRGMFLCCKKVLPKMINKKQGRIINISSIFGVVGGSCEVHYSSSKAAVIGLTKALSKELALSGITVNCIAPGAIETDMLKGYSKQTIEVLEEEIPCKKLGKPLDVASVALFLASKQADYITGQVINVSGGFGF